MKLANLTKEKLISKIRELEQEIARNNEEKYSTFIENSNDGIVVIKAGKVVFVNEARTKDLGYRVHDVIGKNFIDFIAPEFRDVVLQKSIARLSGKAVPRITQIELLRKDSSRLLVEINTSLINYDGESALLVFIRNISERKNSENELKESESRLKDAQRLAKLGHWSLDIINNKLYWSDEVFRLFGLEPQEFEPTYEGFLNNIHPDDREMVDKAYSDSLITKKPYDIIHRLKRKDGTIKYVNEKCVTEFDQNGKAVHSTGTIQDITERKNAEIALRKNEQNLQLIYDTIAEVLYQLKVEPNDRFTFLSVNNAFLTATGLTEEQVLGKTIDEIIPESSRTLLLENYKTAIREKRVVQWEESSVYPSGKKIGDVTISPAFDDDGNCTHLIGTVYDLTELKQSVEELKKSEEKYYGMLQNLMEGFYSSTIDGKLLEYNPEFVRILGLDPKKNYRGIKLPNFWQNPEDRKHYVEEFMRNGFIKNYRVNAKKSDGEKIICDLSSMLINDEVGKPLRIEGTFMDITMRLQADEEIRKLNEELEKKVIKGTEELIQEKNFSEAIINSLPGIFSLIDADGRHILWNKNHEEITGYSPKEYKHMKAFDFFSEANKKIIWEEMSQLDTKDEITVEVNLLTKSGKEIPYFFTGINVSINNKKYIAGMGIDISERKLAETELRKKTEELEIFNKAMIDRELRIIEMKEDVNKLSTQLGLEPQYPEVWKNNGHTDKEV